MFDVTQIRSGLEKKNLKEDVEYIDDVLSKVVYTRDITDDDIILKVPDYKAIIEFLKGITHSHDNLAVLDKITNVMVDSWDSISPTKLSQLINDAEYVTKEYVDNQIKNITGDLSKELILKSVNNTNYLVTADTKGSLITMKVISENDINKNLILTSPDGSKFIVKIDGDGVLNTSKLERC